MLLLAERCDLTDRLASFSTSQFCAQYWSDKPRSYQQVHYGERNKATMLATDPSLHKRMRELADAYALKGRAPRQATFASMQFITQERTRVWSGNKEVYPTVYHDCIPGKEWLQAHEHDEYPEPTMEITVDGKTLHLNGNYKTGMVKAFMASNRRGKDETR